MSVNKKKYQEIISELGKETKLVAVSKTKPNGDIMELYHSGQKDFGENYVQELSDKYDQLPHDINWHFIGHLQSNKVKYIAPFVYLIHSVDSLKLLQEINKQGEKNQRIINCLLQVHISKEETKFGFDENELQELFDSELDKLKELKNIKICGLMGMATFTEDIQIIRREFKFLKSLFDKYSQFKIYNSQFTTLSIGMSADYKIAIEEGSNLIRIGSLLFGERTKAVAKTS